MKRKRKETKLYISTDEIEELHDRYAPIFKQFAADETLSKIEYENDINNVSAEITIAQLLTSSELPKDENGKHLSRRKLEKLFKDPLNFLALFDIEETDEQGEEAEPQNGANEQGETPATLPIRQKRRAAEQSEQLQGQIGIDEINAENGE